MNRRMLIVVCCLVAVLLLGAFPISAQEVPGITIADIIAAAARGSEPEFTTLSAMILSADSSVLAALDNPNNFITLFAPTDEAFRQLRETRYGAATFDLLIRNRDMVTQMMLYHIVSGSYNSADLEGQIVSAGTNGLDLPTLQGQFLHFTHAPDRDDFVIDGEASPIPTGVAITIAGENQSLTIASRDVTAVNGTIHMIDRVLVPTTASVVQVLSDETNFARSNSFTSFLHAVAVADPSVSRLLLDPTSEITVLVPTDAAFDVFETPIATMLTNVQETSDAVAYHILPGRFSSYEILARMADSDDGTAVINTSLGGMFRRTAVSFGLNEEEEVVVNGGARIIQTNVDAGRGIIHVIDAVLQPPQ